MVLVPGAEALAVVEVALEVALATADATGCEVV
jgi:hypothetical protein